MKEILKDCGAIKFGDFILAGRNKSRYYIDVRKAVTKPKILKLMCDRIIKKMKDHAIEADYIACVELGAVPIGTIISDRTQIPLIIVRKEEKDHGIGNRLIGDFETCKKVLLLEDVTASGGSVLSAAKALKDEGLIVNIIIAIVDREEGADVAISNAGMVLIPLITTGKLLEGLLDISHIR